MEVLEKQLQHAEEEQEQEVEGVEAGEEEL